MFVRLRVALLVDGNVGRTAQRSDDLKRRQRDAKNTDEHDRVERVVLLELFAQREVKHFRFRFTAHFYPNSIFRRFLR